MIKKKALTAIGLMSGTSLDGIDAAVIKTDGEIIESVGVAATYPYENDLRNRLKALVGRPFKNDPFSVETVQGLTLAHVEAVNQLLKLSGKSHENIDIIGFHGQTIYHAPAQKVTYQIGDGALLAKKTRIKVVADFRSNDIAHGGQGAPLVPLFHKALSTTLEKPLCILNIGGVANVTWLSPDGGILAFDTGPGNAVINDWVMETLGTEMDQGGMLAKSGTVDTSILVKMLKNSYFFKPYPKSLDRNDFNLELIRGLSPADGAATLTAFTASCIALAETKFPALPIRWLVAGGGRHNRCMMAELRKRLRSEVAPVETAGWQGDAVEAQAFGFLAVRSLYGMSLTVPATTGCDRPISGGVLFNF